MNLIFARLHELLKLSELREIAEHHKNIDLNQRIDFLRIFELESLYETIQYENVTHESIKNAEKSIAMRACVVLHELASRLHAKEKK